MVGVPLGSYHSSQRPPLPPHLLSSIKFKAMQVRGTLTLPAAPRPNNVAECGLEGVNLLGLSRFALRQSKYLISELKTTTELSVKTQNEHSA